MHILDQHRFRNFGVVSAFTSIVCMVIAWTTGFIRTIAGADLPWDQKIYGVRIPNFPGMQKGTGLVVGTQHVLKNENSKEVQQVMIWGLSESGNNHVSALLEIAIGGDGTPSEGPDARHDVVTSGPRNLEDQQKRCTAIDGTTNLRKLVADAASPKNYGSRSYKSDDSKAAKPVTPAHEFLANWGTIYKQKFGDDAAKLAKALIGKEVKAVGIGSGGRVCRVVAAAPITEDKIVLFVWGNYESHYSSNTMVARFEHDEWKIRDRREHFPEPSILGKAIDMKDNRVKEFYYDGPVYQWRQQILPKLNAAINRAAKILSKAKLGS